MNRFSSFPLFNSHLDLAHSYWKTSLAATVGQHGRIIIDATCGNGHDTLFLAQTAILPDTAALPKSRLIAIDKQSQAVEATQNLLKQHLPAACLAHIEFHNRCHSSFPESLPPASVALIVYNLGYLPGGDKAVTTVYDSTLRSLANALPLMQPGGIVSITCYPGHPAGALEKKAILEFAASLPPSAWSCCHHRWLNRKAAPSLLLLQKAVAA